MIVVGEPENVRKSDILTEISSNIGVVNIGSIRKVSIPFDNKGNVDLYVSDIYVSDSDILELFDFLNPDFPILIPENQTFNFQFVFRATKAYSKNKADIQLKVYYFDENHDRKHKQIKLTFTFAIETERQLYPLVVQYKRPIIVKKGIVSLKVRPLVDKAQASRVSKSDFQKSVTNITFLVKHVGNQEYELMNSLILDNGELIFWSKSDSLIGKSVSKLEILQLVPKGVIGQIVSCYVS